MNKAELKGFMEKIKANYQEFSIESYVVNEWYSKLKDFDIEDVEKKLEQHLNGEYRKSIPRLNFIASGLKTPAQKEASKTIRIKCQYCGDIIDLKQIDNHIARHNSIAYIKSRERYLDQENDVDELMNLTEVYFQKVYKNFLESLYCVIEEGDEKERIEKLIFDKEGWEFI